ncbi:hypothetical protein Avbf_17529, partial [Armadillidium vulgare]
NFLVKEELEPSIMAFINMGRGDSKVNIVSSGNGSGLGLGPGAGAGAGSGAGADSTITEIIEMTTRKKYAKY